MMRSPGLILTLLVLALPRSLYAQCPSPDFNLAATACRDQNLTLTNLSGAGTFEWDYCTGDFANTPTGSAGYTLTGATGRPAFEYAKDGNKWYAFVTGTFSNKLYRITFDDPSQAPALTENLGDLGGKLHGPGSIRIINDNGNWFGLLHNTDNGELLKLSFGSSLANNFTVTTLFTGVGSINAGLAVVRDGANGWVCVISTNPVFTIVRLGNDLSSSDMITTASVPNPNALFDVDLVKSCDQWYGFATNLGDGSVFRLSFGTTLFQQPTIDRIADLGGFVNGGRLRVVKDGEVYHLIVTTLGGDLYKIGLGSDLANITANPDNEGKFSLLANSIGVGVVLNNSTWNISVVDAGTGSVSIVKYPNTCSVTEFDASMGAPGIRYSLQGTYHVSLTMTDASGISNTVTKDISVSNSVSPDVAITTQDVCVDHNVTFTANSVAGGISAYDWDFEDGSAHSNATQPTHVYSTEGTYHPSVSVSAANGCTNIATVDLKLYVQPVAAFTVPSGLVCTNNEYTFVNNTAGNYDNLLAYSWSIDGTQVSTSRDLLYTFSNTGNEDITLDVSIPGCSDEITKSITGIDSGPTVAFTFVGQCEGEEISFTNGSAGSITGYLWAFDDGSTSTATDPTHPFDDPGVYSVALNTTGTNGCVSTLKHDVTVYTSPQPSLSLDLPPFSCSGTPSQFHDATGSLPDSNIQTWTWTFGDGGNGNGKNPVHTYVNAGSYNVDLSVLTDKGCSGNTTQQVTITQSPSASFNAGPACVNQPTKLTDSSTGTISTWQWKIGSAVYTAQNPQHTFTIPGNYPVQLTVTGRNNCSGTITNQVNVPVVPAVEFEVGNPCAGQDAVFTDVTSSGDDPVTQANWTFNNDANATGHEVAFSFGTAGTYPTSLKVKTQSGCFYNGSQQVTINPSPVASFTMSDQSGPPPLHVSFTNTSTGAFSYEWNFNDGNPPISDVSTEYTYAAVGDYAVNLTASNTDGCRSTIIKVVNVVEPLNELALEDFTLVQPSGNNAYRGYIRVRNNGNYRIGGFFVTYGVGGGLLLRETVVAALDKGEVSTFMLSNEFLSPGPSAYICAELDNDNDPTNNKACETFGDVAVVLDSYPNPADINLNIESVLPAAGVVHVRLYSASGGLSYDRSFDATAGLSQLSLDVQNLSPGIYIAVITAGSATSSQRILIAR